MTHRTDTEGGTMTLEKGLAAFLDAMLGKNRSSATLRAYRTDILQFMTFLHENNVAITEVGDVGKVDVLNRSTRDSYTRYHGNTDIVRLRVLPVCQCCVA